MYSDINECVRSTEICDQRCVNTAGSYYCICEVGYELQDDKKTCKVNGKYTSIKNIYNTRVEQKMVILIKLMLTSKAKF